MAGSAVSAFAAGLGNDPKNRSQSTKSTKDTKEINLMLRSHSPFRCIGIYTTRYLGMDCRDPEARDGNAKYIGLFWTDEMYFLYCFSHPCVLDSDNPCRNDGAGTCVDTYALEAGYILIVRICHERMDIPRYLDN